MFSLKTNIFNYKLVKVILRCFENNYATFELSLPNSVAPKLQHTKICDVCDAGARVILRNFICLCCKNFCDMKKKQKKLSACKLPTLIDI